MKNKNMVSIAVGFCGVAYGLYCQHKMNKVTSKLDKSIDDIGSDMAIDIPIKDLNNILNVLASSNIKEKEK